MTGARHHGLEMNPAWIVQHRLNQQRRLVELLQQLPRADEHAGDAGPVANEGAAALVADDGEAEVGRRR